MCRVIAYMGPPVLLADLLWEPELSLVKQTYASKMSALLNLAGFGMALWSKDYPHAPLIYKSTQIPLFDTNLRSLSQNLTTTSCLAHIRGIDLSHYDDVLSSNLHPFHMEGTPLVLAHNGFLKNFEQMRLYLPRYIRPEILNNIRGRTDSEWVYGVFLSQFPKHEETWDREDAVEALHRTIEILKTIRAFCGIETTSTLNLFISNGDWLLATRYVFSFGCYGDTIDYYDLNFISLWYAIGETYNNADGEYRIRGSSNHNAYIVSSEPLTSDISSWREVPEYSLLQMYKENGNYCSKIDPLEV